MSKHTRNVHVWRTRTADGLRREVQAVLHGSRWELSSRCEDEEEWTAHQPPLLEDLIELHDTLFRKYQRKHLAWEKLEGVQNLIDSMRDEEPGQDPGRAARPTR
jgi:hypothetical protein